MTKSTQEELLPIIDKIWKIMEVECSEPVQIMEILEFTLARVAIQMGDHDKAVYLASHAHRHTLQIIDQMFDKEIVRTAKLWKDEP